MGLLLEEIADRTNDVLLNESANDYSTLSQARRNRLIYNGIIAYSRMRPLVSVEVMTGTDDPWYELPSDYEVGFSAIQSIEYPVEKSPAQFIDDKWFRVETMPAGDRLRFSQNNPTTGQAFWVRFTRRHVVESTTESDIPSASLDGLSYLCASYMASSLASFYSSKSNPSLPEVEIVGYQTRSAEYSKNAKSFLLLAEKILKPADQNCVWGDLDFVQDQWFDRDSR